MGYPDRHAYRRYTLTKSSRRVRALRLIQNFFNDEPTTQDIRTNDITDTGTNTNTNSKRPRYRYKMKNNTDTEGLDVRTHS